MSQEIKVNKDLGISQVQGNFGTGSLVNQQYYLLEKLEEQALYTIQLKEEKDSEIRELKARLQVLEAQQQQNTQK